jgi:hypothetical protein
MSSFDLQTWLQQLAIHHVHVSRKPQMIPKHPKYVVLKHTDSLKRPKFKPLMIPLSNSGVNTAKSTEKATQKSGNVSVHGMSST